jgi:hypothetical protein
MVLNRHEKEYLRQKELLEGHFKELDKGISAADFKELEDTVLAVFKGPLIEDEDDLDLLKFYEFNKSDYSRHLLDVKIERVLNAAGAARVENPEIQENE